MEDADFSSVAETTANFRSFLKSDIDLDGKIALKVNMETNLDKDIAGELSNFDDFGILHTCDNVFTDTSVMCLTQEQFDIQPIDDPEEQDLPVYGPLCEFDTQPMIYEANVVDPGAVPGVCGLRNLGNTCFMNSGLQCLLNNKIFKSYFVEKNFEMTGKDSLSYKFAELMKNVWSGSFSTLHLGEFKEAFGKTHSQFRNFRQHDCQEFLALLLDTMHEELNSVNQAKLSMSKGYLDNLTNDCKPQNSSQTSKAALEADEKLKFCDEMPESTKCEMNHKTSVLNPNKCESTYLNTTLNVSCKAGNPDNLLKNLMPANNAKQIENDSASIKKCSFESDTIYERNTEKMADLLINNNSNNKLGKILNKNDLEVTHNASNESHSSLKEKSIEKNQMSPKNSVNENKLEKNELAYKLNSVRKIPSIDDFVKDTKILNTNMLVLDETNNLFKFDSEKFPKYESNRLQETVDNLGPILDLGAKQSGTKRIKMTNIMHEKHKFLENVDPVSSCFALHKRLKMENMDSFENHMIDQDDVIETEPMQDECSEESSQSSELNSDCRTFSFLEEVRRAVNHWDKYKVLNQSVIVDTFHGQFRSSVVCSHCSYVSITYEPFMYLPVFLPHALERQIVITFVQNDGSAPVRYLVNVNKYEHVHKMREGLQKLLDVSPAEILFAEVFENHISRILDEAMSIDRVNDSSRTVYAFEVGRNVEQDSTSSPNRSVIPLPFNTVKRESKDDAINALKNANVCDTPKLNQHSSPPSESKLDNFSIGETSKADDMVPKNVMSHTDNDIELGQTHTCAICLEDMPDYNLLFHPQCDCILCETCIEVSCKHYGGGASFICPVCSTSVTPLNDFVPLNNVDGQKLKIRTIPIPIVFRNDLFDGETLKSKTLLGHPGLLKLPSSLSATKLYEHVENAIPFAATYSLLFVNCQGKNCSRCIFAKHCSGCEISRVGDITFKHGDNLAVRYIGLSEEYLETASYVSEHKSMQQPRHKTPLDIYDCLQSFSERERLDEDSPWFCPMCRQNRQATKSLSVWKFPEVLIICLKRFVFLGYTSMKVEDKVTYPLEGLDLSAFSSGPFSGDLVYDLQACVCHFGGLSAGHYTSYSKHALTDEWYYFNDENVKMEAPKIDECVNEYILFYQRR